MKGQNFCCEMIPYPIVLYLYPDDWTGVLKLIESGPTLLLGVVTKTVSQAQSRH